MESFTPTSASPFRLIQGSGNSTSFIGPLICSGDAGRDAEQLIKRLVARIDMMYKRILIDVTECGMAVARCLLRLAPKQK
jgi:hypothetical protein